MNTNIIWFENIDQIRIRILFSLKKSIEYEYEYYLVWKYRPNTNTNIIGLEKITRIRIRILVFGLSYSNNIRILNYSLTSEVMSTQLSYILKVLFRDTPLPPPTIPQFINIFYLIHPILIFTLQSHSFWCWDMVDQPFERRNICPAPLHLIQVCPISRNYWSWSKTL